MHGHPSSDRFIRDSGATIMATGYVYARLRSRDPLSSRRDGMRALPRRFLGSLRSCSPRVPSPSSNEYRMDLAPLSPIYLSANIPARNGVRSYSNGLFPRRIFSLSLSLSILFFSRKMEKEIFPPGCGNRE